MGHWEIQYGTVRVVFGEIESFLSMTDGLRKLLARNTSEGFATVYPSSVFAPRTKTNQQYARRANSQPEELLEAILACRHAVGIWTITSPGAGASHGANSIIKMSGHRMVTTIAMRFLLVVFMNGFNVNYPGYNGVAKPVMTETFVAFRFR